MRTESLSQNRQEENNECVDWRVLRSPSRVLSWILRWLLLEFLEFSEYFSANQEEKQFLKHEEGDVRILDSYPVDVKVGRLLTFLANLFGTQSVNPNSNDHVNVRKWKAAKSTFKLDRWHSFNICCSKMWSNILTWLEMISWETGHLRVREFLLFQSWQMSGLYTGHVLVRSFSGK